MRSGGGGGGGGGGGQFHNDWNSRRPCQQGELLKKYGNWLNPHRLNNDIKVHLR